MRVTNPIPPPPPPTAARLTPLWRPLTASSSARLFFTGATVGPVVDSLHNQCLLKYNVAPITLDWPTTTTTTASSAILFNDMVSSSSSSTHLFASSWTVFPLLGVAYVVLGGLLPRIFEYAVAALGLPTTKNKVVTLQRQVSPQSNKNARIQKETTMRFLDLKSRAILAVVTTAVIIKLSEYLTLHPTNNRFFLPSTTFGTVVQQQQDVFLLLLTALGQWALLDTSLPALLTASVTSIGGPLAELPFVAQGIWEYLPTAADYFPLEDIIIATDTTASGSISATADLLFQNVLGPNYQQLGLSSITGPCYFAVTIDAIELGRWFDSMDHQNTNDNDKDES